MKKLILLFVLAVSVAAISGYKQSAKKALTTNYSYRTSMSDKIEGNMSATGESKSGTVSNSDKSSTSESPRILLLLTNDTGSATWVPSLWWNYKHVKPGQAGC